MKASHMDVVACRKAAIQGWEPFRYEAIGSDASLINGGVPRLLKSGPRKGNKTWDGCHVTRVVVTHAEVEAELEKYEAETGNCGECYGEGEVLSGWHHISGTKYKACRKCDGSGVLQSMARSGL